MLTRRAAMAMLAGLPAMRGARGQSDPVRSVTIVVPAPSGGPADAIARLIAQTLGTSFGQPIAVDIRAGGGGVPGTLAVARARPDGRVLVLGSNQTHAASQSLLKNCPYDAVRDFAPVGGIATMPHVLVARTSLRLDAVAELVAAAKAMPDNFYYGSPGTGSASHLLGELFKLRVGADLRHVPLPGDGPMLSALLVNRIDVSFAALPSVLARIETGELKVLAVASARRSALLPQVPTLTELGVAGVEADGWLALFAPVRTPATTIERLYDTIVTALRAQATHAAMARLGMTFTLRPPAEVAAWLPGEVARWAALIKAVGVVVE